MKRTIRFTDIQSVILLILLVITGTQQANAQVYCSPSTQMSCFYGDKITNVTFAGINHTDDVCTVDFEGMKDFTGTVAPAQLTAGQSYLLSVTVENNLPSGTERVRVWIDFNKNYTFESTESFDLGVGTGNTILTANIPVPAGAVSGTTRMRVMYRRTSANTLDAGDACHSFGGFRGQAKDYAVTINGSSACTAALSPGNTISTLSSACPGENFTLSLQNTVSGTTYQWQSSPNGTTWTNISGATASTLVTSHTTATYYKCIVTCMSNTGNSNALQVNSSGPVYTTLPVNESFELWSNMCGGTTNVPGSSWLTTPSTGNNSWRRDDQGTSASWDATATGMYTPAFSHGTHSARFHTGSAGNNAQGTLDLYVNCSAGNPGKQLTFNYINANGTDKLRVLLSTDGGQNFTQLGTDLLTVSTWTSQLRTLTSSSSTVVVRLMAISDNQLSDIGVDNFSLQAVALCNMPTALAVAGLTTISANISWTASVPVPVSGYEYVLSTNNTVPTASGTSISGTVYNASSLVPNTNYYFFVRAACGGGSFSGWTSIAFTTTVTPCAAPTSPVISAITNNSAVISWTAPTPAPAGGYEYAISTANNVPSGSGTPVSGVSVPVNGLIANKVYYVFIRSKCSNGNYSSWVPAYFTTKGTTGVEDLEAILELSIFPNPAGEMITVTINESVEVNQISLRSITGELVLSVKASGNKETFSLSQLAAGAYLMQIETDRGTLTKQFHVIH